MRTKAAMTVLIAGTMMMAGCATMDARHTGVTYGELAGAERYVATVNREARRRGLQVYWVNPPTRDERRKVASDLDDF